VGHAGGLVIEVETSEGHKDYWILTPEDIARQSDS
jgi:nickel transport protein